MTNSSHTSASFQIAGRSLSDWLVPIVIFVFCGIVIYLTTTFDEAPAITIGNSMQPRDFPLFLVLVIAVLNVFLILQIIKKPPPQRENLPYQFWVSLVLIAVYYVLHVYMDMFIALMVVMFIMSLVLGERRIWLAALMAVSVPVSIFLLFDFVLKVRFPRGYLTNYYYDSLKPALMALF